jgi:hypothetical protein
MSDKAMTPDTALGHVLDVVDNWLENERDSIFDSFGAQAMDNPREVLADESTEDPFDELVRYADAVEAVAVLQEQLREASDDTEQTPKALTEVHDAPGFEEAKRIQLIRNRAAFLHGLGDASVAGDWIDLSYSELDERYGWVLDFEEHTETHIDWPENCRK